MGRLVIFNPLEFSSISRILTSLTYLLKRRGDSLSTADSFFLKGDSGVQLRGPISTPPPWSKLRGLISALPLPPLRPEQHVAPNMTFLRYDSGVQLSGHTPQPSLSPLV